VQVAVGAVQAGVDERRLGAQGVSVGHHGEIAFGFVAHLAQPGEVEHAALAQLSVEVVVGQSTHPQLAAAQLAVVDKDPDPVSNSLPATGRNRSRLASRWTAIRVSNAAAPVA